MTWKLSKKKSFSWCEKQLVYYKIPSEIIFVKMIPRTSIGKVLRRELIKDYVKKDPI